VAQIAPDEPCPCGSGIAFKDCHGPKVRKREPPEIKQRIHLNVIPEPDPNSRAVFEKAGDGTILFQGFETNIALVCGSCGAPLAAGLEPIQIKDIVLRCNKCSAFNDT
jgi:DNA-directed RNA polymerase subunit RPC12/RpoP